MPRNLIPAGGILTLNEIVKNIWTVLILSVVILSCVHCEGGAGIYEVAETEQAIYFQYEYINHAWGYQHNGWLIDSSGAVYCFNKPENWHHADSLGFISVAQMESNILSTDSVCNTVDKEVLVSKIGLIEAASKGRISEPVHEMYDAGGTVYSAFMYNSKEKVYKKILLKQLGDFRIDNSSPAAKNLYQWLESVNSLMRENN